MQLQNRLALQMILLSAALTLSACGGGGSSSATTNNTSTPAGSTDTPSGGGTSGGTTSGTTSGGTTPSGGGGTPEPTPTAAECPFGDYKSDVVAQVNAYRASARVCGATTYPAVGALSWNGALASAAEVHSNDMAVNNYFDHPDANGVRIGGRAANAGYSYGSVGENIAGGQTSASSVVAAWMASESHCKNIMTASFYDIGVSCKTTSTSTYTYYWTLTMGNH